MTRYEFLHAVWFCCVIILGLSLVAYILSPKGRSLESWGRMAFASAAVGVIIWGILQGMLMFGRLSNDAYALVRDYKSMVGGFVIGILVALVLAGEFRKLGRPVQPAGDQAA
jgi:hypothetical protein